MATAVDTIDELRLVGAKTEYYGGCFMDNGEERRFSDHDYRLLVEHGAIPKDTILVAGIVFWREPKVAREEQNTNERRLAIDETTKIGVESGDYFVH